MSLSISRLGASGAAASSITIPGTYNTGDIIFIMAFNSGAGTAPTLVSGWTSIGSSTLNVVGSNFAWKVAASNSETSGTWTNATDIVCAVYHNLALDHNPIGTYSTNGKNNANSSTSVIYQALTPMQSPGTSWVVSMAAIKSINTALSTAPTGETNAATNTGATSQIVAHDSNGKAPYFQTFP